MEKEQEAKNQAKTEKELNFKEYKEAVKSLEKERRELNAVIEAKINTLQKPQPAKTLKNIMAQIKEYDKALSDDKINKDAYAKILKEELQRLELNEKSNYMQSSEGKQRLKDRRSKERIKSVEKQQILDDVDFTSKSVSEQLKVDDILLQNHDNIIPQKNNQSQALDMNDDSALKALKNEVSNTKESEIENNTSSQDYQTELSDNVKHKRQRR